MASEDFLKARNAVNVAAPNIQRKKLACKKNTPPFSVDSVFFLFFHPIAHKRQAHHYTSRGRPRREGVWRVDRRESRSGRASAVSRCFCGLVSTLQNLHTCTMFPRGAEKLRSMLSFIILLLLSMGCFLQHKPLASSEGRLQYNKLA